MRKVFCAAFAALAFVSMYPPLALSDELAAPVAAAVAIPQAGGACLSADAGIAALSILKARHPGTRAYAFIQGAQQSFADAWRAMVKQPSVKVDLTLAWFVDGVAAVSEYGPDGCLMTATVISGAQWDAIVAVLRRNRET